MKKLDSIQNIGGRGSSSEPSGFFRVLWAIVWKDLVAERRSKEMLTAMLVFSLLVILIFNFALELDVNARNNVTSGILWVIFAFAGTLGLNRSMAMEKDQGCLDGLLLAPVDRTAILFGKSISNLIFMWVVAVIILPVYSILYGINLFVPGLVAVIFLGSIGYMTVGTLLSSMTVQTRTRDILLPIVLFPVIVPLLIAAVKASTGFLQGLSFAEMEIWINILVVFDIVFLSVAFMVFDYVVEE